MSIDLNNLRIRRRKSSNVGDELVWKPLQFDDKSLRAESPPKGISNRSRLSSTTRPSMSSSPHSKIKQVKIDEYFSPRTQFYPKFFNRLQGIRNITLERTAVRESDSIISFKRILQAVTFSPKETKIVKKRKRTTYMTMGTHYKNLNAKITLSNMEFNNISVSSTPENCKNKCKHLGFKIIHTPYTNISPFKGEAVGKNVSEVRPIKMIDISTGMSENTSTIRYRNRIKSLK